MTLPSRAGSGEIHESKLLESNQQSFVLTADMLSHSGRHCLNMEKSSGEAVQVIQIFCLLCYLKKKKKNANICLFDILCIPRCNYSSI